MTNRSKHLNEKFDLKKLKNVVQFLQKLVSLPCGG